MASGMTQNDLSVNRRGPITPEQAHVIVVEDNANNLIIVMKLLNMAGVKRINWRTRGHEVVEFVATMAEHDRERKPDLILLDIGLPDEDGYAVLAKLRADPRMRNTRVVAVTAHRALEEMRRARAAGFDGFIGKPLDLERFPDQIRRVLADEAVWELG
jgi:two-component system cell cycle response regulator DivK